MGKRRKRHGGVSYRKRVADINQIYSEHLQSGLSNREIWLRYVYPVFGISERTFYNILNAPAISPIEVYEEPSLFNDDK